MVYSPTHDLGPSRKKTFVRTFSWLGNCANLPSCLPVLPQVRHGLDGLDDARGAPHGDGEGRHVARDDATRADGAPLADGDAGHDGRAAADPAVVADDDGPGVLDAVAARLHADLVGGGVDGDRGPEEHAVADGDEAAVEDDEAEGGAGLVRWKRV